MGSNLSLRGVWEILEIWRALVAILGILRISNEIKFSP